MKQPHPQDLAGFLRKYRFTGGRVRAARITHRGKEAAIEFRLLVREATRDLSADARPVRLVLRLAGVDEFRLQMRPGQPKVFDFRASEAFAAGRELWWEQVERKT